MTTKKIKAPQSQLRSSWRDEVYKKPRTRGMIITKSSRNGRANTTITYQGSVLKSSGMVDIY